MKRRNFLKAIGLGALVAPAVVMAKAEEHTIIIKDNPGRMVLDTQSGNRLDDLDTIYGYRPTPFAVEVYGVVFTVDKDTGKLSEVK